MIDLSQYLEHIKYDYVDDTKQLRCIVRKKWYVVTPEEIVRQCALHHLIHLGYSDRLLSVEKQIKVNGLKRRFDILAYSRSGVPIILIECKAPSVTLSQAGLDQVNSYNHLLKVDYVWFTNGYDNRIYQYADDVTPVSLPDLPMQS